MEYKTIQRVETHLVREGQEGICIKNPKEVVQYMRDLQNADIEKAIAIYLTGRNEIICEAVIGMGTIDYATIEPRDILKIALLTGATSTILIHNHPGGTLETSPEDRAITIILTQACKLFRIKLLDHIIITRDDFYSMNDHGEIPSPQG